MQCNCRWWPIPRGEMIVSLAVYWQFAPVGQAFTGTGVITSVSQWVRALPAAVVLSPTVTGLIHNTAYH